MSSTVRGTCGGSMTVASYPVRKNAATGQPAKKCFTVSTTSYSGSEASVTLSEKELRQLIAALEEQ